MDIYNFIPRLMLHADVAATGLRDQQPRAGGAAAGQRAGRGRGVSSAGQRPAGARRAHRKTWKKPARKSAPRWSAAKRVLGLTALLAVALSAVAVALLPAVCQSPSAGGGGDALPGRQPGDMLWLHLSRFCPGAAGGLAGCALGWLTQKLVPLAQLAQPAGAKPAAGRLAAVGARPGGGRHLAVWLCRAAAAGAAPRAHAGRAARRPADDAAARGSAIC